MTTKGNFFRQGVGHPARGAKRRTQRGDKLRAAKARVVVWVDKDKHEALETAAKSKGLSVSELILAEIRRGRQ